MFAGRINASQLRIVRTIVTPPGPDTVGDTAVFSGTAGRLRHHRRPRNGSATIVHARNNGSSTTARTRLRNIEQLQFTDGPRQIVNLPGQNPPTGTVTLSSLTPAENQALTATRAFNDLDLIPGAIVYDWQMETQPNVFVTTGSAGTTFTPDDAEVGHRLRVVATFTDGDGKLEIVELGPDGGGHERQRPAAGHGDDQ